MKTLKLVNGAAMPRPTREKKVDLIARLFTVVLMTFALPLTVGAAGTTNFVPFADQSTVALWLFDDQPYPHAIITDASQNEYDLILMDGALEPGKFGNALAASSSGNYKVSYAGWQGAISSESEPKGMRIPVPIRDPLPPGDPLKYGLPSGLWGPALNPWKMVNTLTSSDWTLEFWLKLPSSISQTDFYILDLGYGYQPGLTLILKGDATAFQLNNDYGGLHVPCSTDITRLRNGEWHHIAFTSQAKNITHFVDGVAQAGSCEPVAAVSPPPPLPVDPQTINLDQDNCPNSPNPPPSGWCTSDSVKYPQFDDEWRRNNRFNVSLGENRYGAGELNGMLDEIRLSSTVRYSSGGFNPTSFARNYSADGAQPVVPTGPPLLFKTDSPDTPIQLGGRKYVFIDDVLLEKKSEVNVVLTLNPMIRSEQYDDLQRRTTAGVWQPFRAATGQWKETVYDYNGKVYLFVNDGHSSAEGLSYLYVSIPCSDGSDNGRCFAIPNLGVIEYRGSKNNNLIFYKKPMGGTIFKDENPNISPYERFKVTSFDAARGIYLYVSADGIHWRRNETAMLPLISGGDAESFWDDQRGVYVTHLKRDSSYNTPECVGIPGHLGESGRRGVMFQTNKPFEPWPMMVQEKPYFESYPMPAVTCEGTETFPVWWDYIGGDPEQIRREDVYRTRAMKYSWAPDTYVALVWRGIIYSDPVPPTERPGEKQQQIELGYSRDGENWKFYRVPAYPYYMPLAGQVAGKPTNSVQSLFGLIRRGDEIWQYAKYTQDPDGGGTRQFARLRQRLDGFVSLDPVGAGSGSATTLPLVFTGKFLELNVKANNGSVRVGILDESGNEIPGFRLSECSQLSQDSVRARVQWVGGSHVESLAGQTVRLKFELQNAKLYALQFFRTGCDANYDGKVDRTDINALMDARGVPIASDDPRDVDGDGRITVGDSRACVLRCDKPQCAP